MSRGCLWRPSRVLLLRHASIDGVDRLVGRTPAVRLNVAGERQADGLGASLAAAGLGDVLSSPQPRAVQTAHAVARPHGLVPRIAPEFDEMDFGEWTGRPFPDLAADARWLEFNRRGRAASAPGGESIDGVLRRVRGGLRDTSMRAGGRPIAIVTHAEIIRIALAAAFGLSLEDWMHVQPAPASVTILMVDERGACSASVNRRGALNEADALSDRRPAECLE